MKRPHFLLRLLVVRWRVSFYCCSSKVANVPTLHLATIVPPKHTHVSQKRPHFCSLLDGHNNQLFFLFALTLWLYKCKIFM